jgi:hypothetical protein
MSCGPSHASPSFDSITNGFDAPTVPGSPPSAKNCRFPKASPRMYLTYFASCLPAFQVLPSAVAARMLSPPKLPTAAHSPLPNATAR